MINGTVWDFAKALLIDKDVVAEDLSVLSVEVTTLDAGSDATATFDASTGVLTLGLPRGENGAGDMSADVYDPDAKMADVFSASNHVIDPSSVDNDTFTATDVQSAFEQQETKTIYGGSF